MKLFIIFLFLTAFVDANELHQEKGIEENLNEKDEILFKAIYPSPIKNLQEVMKAAYQRYSCDGGYRKEVAFHRESNNTLASRGFLSVEDSDLSEIYLGYNNFGKNRTDFIFISPVRKKDGTIGYNITLSYCLISDIEVDILASYIPFKLEGPYLSNGVTAEVVSLICGKHACTDLLSRLRPFEIDEYNAIFNQARNSLKNENQSLGMDGEDKDTGKDVKQH